MASAKFLEEALSTDVDESAVSALVGSLEDQLVTSTATASSQPIAQAAHNLNHVNNSGIANGGTKHGAIANGDVVSGAATTDGGKILANNSLAAGQMVQQQHHQNPSIVTTNFINATNQVNHPDTKTNESVKIVYSQAMSTAGTIIPNRVAFSTTQNIPNGTIGLSPLAPQTVLQTTTNNVGAQNKQQTIVLKTNVGAPGGASGLVTVPMNVTSVPQVNNVGSLTTQTPTSILPNLQVVNVRPSVPSQPQQKGHQTARVVLSAPHLVGAPRQGAPVS